VWSKVQTYSRDKWNLLISSWCKYHTCPPPTIASQTKQLFPELTRAEWNFPKAFITEGRTEKAKQREKRQGIRDTTLGDIGLPAMWLVSLRDAWDILWTLSYDQDTLHLWKLVFYKMSWLYSPPNINLNCVSLYFSSLAVIPRKAMQLGIQWIHPLCFKSPSLFQQLSKLETLKLPTLKL
jgi:hypothetical protein